LIRDLFEAQIQAQIANEKITACVTDIVEWLTDERRLRGWSVQYMAELLRVEVRTVHRIEQGVAIPRGSTIKRYIEVFGYQYPLTPVLFASKFKPKAVVKKATRIRKPKP
jgi:transcriptional regulator with XRE-family HTH domain